MSLRVSTLAAVLLLTGCPEPPASAPDGGDGAPGSSSGASSSERSSSSGAAGSSSATSLSNPWAASSYASQPGSGPAFPSVGDTLPLEQLCDVLAQGLLRHLAAPGVPTTQEDLDCQPAYQDARSRLSAVVGDAPAQRQAYCSPDGGFLAPVAPAIARSETEGRALYHPDLAARCVQAGRQIFVFAAGDWRESSTVPVAVEQDRLGCAGVVEGLVEPGQLCAYSHECAGGTRGADCVGHGGEGCLGVCRLRGEEGDPCSGQHAGCTTGTTCVGAGTPDARCRAFPAAGFPCLPSGVVQRCADGLVCNPSGTCSDHPVQGERCDPGVARHCADGLYCDAATSRCQPAVGQDEPCHTTWDGSTCQPCLACRAMPDGTPRCRPFADVGQDCSASPCHAGLVCVAGLCGARVDTQVSCLRLAEDVTLRGSCLNREDVCVGSPSRCQRRGHTGDPCESAPTESAEQGTCTEGLFCLRNHAQDRLGNCAGPARLGAACGSAPDLPPTCVVPAQGASACLDPGAGQQSRCAQVTHAPRGAPCAYTANCSRGDDCLPGADGTLTCQPASLRLGSPCTAVSTTGQHCAQGYCHVTASTGTVCVALLPQDSTCIPEEDGCQDGLRCDARADGGFACSPRQPQGETCAGDVECADGLACMGGLCAPRECQDAGTVDSCAGNGNLGVMLLLGLVAAGRKRQAR